MTWRFISTFYILVWHVRPPCLAKNGLKKKGPRKIKTYIERHFNGSKVQINEVYKPDGIKSEWSPALPENIFDLMTLSTPPCTLPWSPEKLQKMRHFYSTLPVCVSMHKIWKLLMTWFQTHHMSWQTMTSQSSIASSGLLISCRRSNSSCLILSNFWQSQTKPWISSIWVWETISTTKKLFWKEKIPLSVDFSKGYFQIRSGKNETKHKLISNASICWIIPKTVSLRQLLKFPFVNSIIQSRLDFSFINRRTNAMPESSAWWWTERTLVYSTRREI